MTQAIDTARVWGQTQQQTINELVRSAVRARPDQPFLDVLGEVQSLQRLNDEACRLANGLSALGIRKGQTVATVLDNSADAVVIWLAINKLGAVSVPVNTAFKGDYLRHHLGDCDASVVVAETEYVSRIESIAHELPHLATVVYRGAVPDVPGFAQRLLAWGELRNADASEPAVEVAPGDLSMIIYTGGTTGASKGCMISHNYACNLARQIGEVTGRSAHTISWTALPLFHLNAVANVLCELMFGGRMAIYPRFSVSNFWPEIERTKANYTTLLGSMVPMLLAAPSSEVEVRCRGQLEILGCAPFPSKLQAAWIERFGTKHAVCPGFGLTEASLITSIPLDVAAKPDSSGLANDSFDVRIIDEQGQEVAPNIPGEIIVRPRKPHVMFEGYWRRPQETMALMKNLWFHTGDIGKFDEDGFFSFVDRKKDYLRRRGENISSFEVESIFRRHTAIADVAVHAVLSTLGEDELKVTAVLRVGTSVSEEALCRWSMDQLPYFAVPRYVEFRSELPRNPVGRVLKYTLRDEGVTAASWDREQAGVVLVKR